MYTPFEEQLQGELSVLKDCYSQIYKELVEAQDEKLEARFKLLLDFTQQINRSVMAENHILTKKSDAINNLLNDLYEGIDEHYTETLENNDELAIVRADAQLKLIKAIIDKMEEIWLKKQYV